MADAGDGEELEVKGPTPVEIVSFVRGAARRRPKLGVMAFLVASVLGIAASVLKPPVYTTDVTIAARTQNAVRKTTTGDGNTYENLTKGAATAILNDDNLVALVADAEIAKRWDAERTPVFHLKDRITERLFGKPSQQDFERGLVGMLSKRLSVNTSGDDTINIRVEWPTREGAYRIVTAAQARFMSTQRANDVAMIGEGVTILQTYVQEQGAEVAKALEDLKRLKESASAEVDAGIAKVAPPADGGSATASASAAGSASAPRPPPRVVNRAPLPAPVPTVDPAIKRDLEDKKQELLALEDDRRKRLSEAQAQLADLSGTLGPAHPQVVALQHKVETLSQPAPQAVELREAVSALENQVTEANDLSVEHAKKYLGANVDGTAVPLRRVDAGVNAGGIVIMTESQDDPATIAAKEKLAGLTQRYDELKGRLRSAKIEMDVAEAAFKYKYIVMAPAEMPKKPKPPPAFVFAIAGVVFGMALFFLLPAMFDLVSGRIIASWQVRKLGVDVLGEIDSHT